MCQKLGKSALLLLLMVSLSYQAFDSASSLEDRLKRIFRGYGYIESSLTSPKKTRGFLEKRKKNPVQGLQDHLESNPYFPYKPVTGYIDIYEEEGNSMFYWLSPARENPDTAPVVIWMEGGPGGSSVGSLFWSIGPLRIKNYPVDEKTPTIRKISWNQKANVIFPDYPLGTGFSINTAAHQTRTRKDIEFQMLKFYQGFLEKHTEFKGREIFVAGQSYGGHGAPYAAYPLKYSGNFNVKGLFITSGLISGIDMFGSYPEFALLNKNYTKITQQEYEVMSNQRDICVHMMKQDPNNLFAYNGFTTCETLYFDRFLYNTFLKNNKFNPYYMKGGFKDDFTFAKFLNSTGVKQYLQVRKDNYEFLNITQFLTIGPNDFRLSSSPLIGQMLDDGVRAVVVDGTEDFICNYQQSEKSFIDMDWSGKQGWSMAVRKPCKYGLCKEYRNLKEIRVAGSGHGISIYRPEFGLEIVNTLMFGDEE